MNRFRIVSGLLLLSAPCAAQQYIISTIAGGVPPPTPVPALNASFGYTGGVATDGAGNVYFTASNCVFRIDSSGVLTRVAGNSRGGYAGDGGSATSAQLNNPGGLAVDGSGNVYVADTANNRVRKITTTGIIVTVAGNGSQVFAGDGGPATNAGLNGPGAVAVDASGNLFIAEYNRVRKVPPNGIIVTIAGNGSPGYSGDGGPAVNAQLNGPYGIAVDGVGNLFIADSGNNRIRRIAANGTISTVAGNGSPGFSGDGGPATSAELNGPDAVAVDGSGDIFIGDLGNFDVREVGAGGNITTFTDNGTNLGLSPSGIATDGLGNVFVADGEIVVMISPSGAFTGIAGNGNFSYSGDGGPAVNAQIGASTGIAADAAGNVYIPAAGRVRKISTDGTIKTVAGDGEISITLQNGGVATNTPIEPSGVAVDASGNFFFVDLFDVRKVSANGIISTVAGMYSTAGFRGDGGPATSAALNRPQGLAVDSSGNLYIADTGNLRVRKVSTGGIITTVAGNGSTLFADGVPATSSGLDDPTGVAVDASGNLYIADGGYFYSRIRKVSTSGVITTVAGNGVQGFSGDGGMATSASLNGSPAVAVDSLGNLFIGDYYNQRVRKVSTDGIITTVAGNGHGSFAYGSAVPPGEYSGDGGVGTKAELFLPRSVAVDGAGNVYIGDSGNYALRKLTPTNKTTLITAVVDAASESAIPISPGKIIVIYGSGLGPVAGATAAPSNGFFGTQLAGTTVSINGVPAPIYYASDAQVNAIVPYATSGSTAAITVSYGGGVSSAFSIPVAASSPSIFSYNATGAGQAAAINVADGTLNTAANPVKIGAYISFYATGEGQTTPAGVDGKLATLPLPAPNLPVSATVGGIPAAVQYRGAVYGAVAGLMQVNVQIPAEVAPGGYVPVVLHVGNASTVNGALWVAVSN